VPVDDELLNDAREASEVTDIRELRPGGQKTVRLVGRNGEELVMKVISVDSGAPTTLRRAQREVELLQQIDNEHVVKVASDLVELGEPVRGVAWLEEFLDGADLSDRLAVRWSWDETCEMAIQVADARCPACRQGCSQGFEREQCSPNDGWTLRRHGSRLCAAHAPQRSNCGRPTGHAGLSKP
jgi:hypothetical protein